MYLSSNNIPVRQQLLPILASRLDKDSLDTLCDKTEELITLVKFVVALVLSVNFDTLPG